MTRWSLFLQTLSLLLHHFLGLYFLVYANPVDKSVHIFVCSVQGTVLEFKWVNGRLQDRQTGTLWDPAKGFAMDGPLRRELLKELPYSTAYDWAWEDFYPDT